MIQPNKLNSVVTIFNMTGPDRESHGGLPPNPVMLRISGLAPSLPVIAHSVGRLRW
jgi:hypothetical protein